MQSSSRDQQDHLGGAKVQVVHAVQVHILHVPAEEGLHSTHLINSLTAGACHKQVVHDLPRVTTSVQAVLERTFHMPK